MTDTVSTLIVRDLGLSDYAEVWQAMQTFTSQRTDTSPDELWLVEHPPVYTLGMNSDRAHILDAGSIPVVATDRGGQVTYHGPGQLVLYPLLDISRRHLGIKQVVAQLEQMIIDYLASLAVVAARRPKAPGVYVADAKIAALGLRVRRGRCYHGLSFNINMDLTPFTGINPCGYEHMAVTQLSACVTAGSLPPLPGIKAHLLTHFRRLLGYNFANDEIPC